MIYRIIVKRKCNMKFVKNIQCRVPCHRMINRSLQEYLPSLTSKYISEVNSVFIRDISQTSFNQPQTINVAQVNPRLETRLEARLAS